MASRHVQLPQRPVAVAAPAVQTVEVSDEDLLDAARHYYPELIDPQVRGAEVVCKNGLGQTVFVNVDILVARMAADVPPTRAAASDAAQQ